MVKGKRKKNVFRLLIMAAVAAADTSGLVKYALLVNYFFVYIGT